MTSGIVDIRCRLVTCCRKRDAECVAYVDAYVAAAENARYADCAETGDDECAADDAAFDREAIANAADEKETDDAQCAFADAMESSEAIANAAADAADAAADADDVGDGAAEDGAGTVALGDHDVAVTNKILLL